MHVGDEGIVEPFTFSKMTNGKRPSRSSRIENAGNAEFRVDFLGDADDVVGMLGFQILINPRRSGV